MRYEKTLCAFIVIFCIGYLSCCCSNNVRSDGGTAAEVRSDLSELQSEQSDSAATTERIVNTSSELAEQSAEIADGIGNAQATITEREDIDSAFKRILEEIRNQRSTPGRENPGTDSDHNGEGS